MKKLIRISTVPTSLDVFLKGFLKELLEKYEVLAVSSPGEELAQIGEREGVRTVAVAMERHISILKDVVSLYRLIVLFARERPYMVHSITPKAGLLAMLAAWFTRVPVRIHTFTGLVFPTSTGVKRQILILMDRVICGCATYINPEGRGVANDLKQYGITRKPLHIIANGNVRGVDMRWYSCTEEVVKQSELMRENDCFTFCFVGRLVGDKGINELIQAFTRLSDIYPKVRLLLVGGREDSLDPLQEDTLVKIRTNERIVSVGSQRDVRPYLAASDAFVFPSYREGFPNVVLEAGAMGLACIVTDINGSNEIIIPGENGEIIPPRDENALYNKMKEWVENPEKVSKMAANARHLIESRYEQKMVWIALLDEYNRLLKEIEFKK